MDINLLSISGNVEMHVTQRQFSAHKKILFFTYTNICSSVDYINGKFVDKHVIEKSLRKKHFKSVLFMKMIVKNFCYAKNKKNVNTAGILSWKPYDQQVTRHLLLKYSVQNMIAICNLLRG